MAAFPEGVAVAEYLVVIPFRPAYLNQGADADPAIRFMIWGSQGRDWDQPLHAQQWLNHPQVLHLGGWNPKNVAQIGTSIYFHLSENDLICFDLQGGDSEHIDLSVQLLETEQRALCIWNGQLCFMSLLSTDVQIYVLQHNQWIMAHEIGLLNHIEEYRYVFRSLTMTLRNRAVETPAEAMEGATVVGYAEPNWLLLRQRGSFIIMNEEMMLQGNEDGRPRRVMLNNARGNFFMSHCSSFVQVI
uniref:Uncharacterized protein n=1 Tax=Triticum urartu TaxID=4572 RepID=A0A8R7PH49_TRIUA